MPADPNRRAKATVDAIDAILDRWPESEKPAKDPERVERGKLGGSRGQEKTPASEQSGKIALEGVQSKARHLHASRWFEPAYGTRIRASRGMAMDETTVRQTLSQLRDELRGNRRSPGLKGDLQGGLQGLTAILPRGKTCPCQGGSAWSNRSVAFGIRSAIARAARLAASYAAAGALVMPSS